MCWDILRSPASALQRAKKGKSAGKAWLTLVEASILLALAAAVVSYNVFGSAAIAVTAVAATFVLALVVGILLAWVVTLATTTLGGKGAFREGLTAVSYSLVFFGVGLFISSLLSLAPVLGTAVGALVLLATAAVGIATFYRGIKELFATDMITAFVAASVVVLAVFIAMWGTVGLGLAGGLGSILPGAMM